MRQPSRPARWTAAASDAADALARLKDIQDEYQDWRDNLPENMEEGATAEKLDAILELDLDDLQAQLDEIEQADLPRPGLTPNQPTEGNNDHDTQSASHPSHLQPLPAAAVHRPGNPQ